MINPLFSVRARFYFRGLNSAQSIGVDAQCVCAQSFSGIASFDSRRRTVSASGECCVLPGRVLCDCQVTRPEEFYRVCVLACVCACVRVLECVWVLK